MNWIYKINNKIKIICFNKCEKYIIKIKNYLKNNINKCKIVNLVKKYKY